MAGNGIVLLTTVEQWVQESEPMIWANVLFYVVLAAGLVIFFYGGGKLLDWISKKWKNRKR